MGIKYGAFLAGLLSLGLIASQSPASAFNTDNQSGPFFGVRLTVLNPDNHRMMVADNTAHSYRNSFESPGFGLQYGIAWRNQWQLRSYFDRIRVNVSGDQGDVWGHSYGVDAIHRFDSGLYAGLGINNTRTNRQRNAMVRGTLGYQIELRDRFYSDVEYSLQTEGDFTDQMISWSLNYRLGRDPHAQSLPREFRTRRSPPQSSTSPPRRRSPASGEPDSGDESLTSLRQPPAELPFAFNSATLNQVWYGAVGRIADLLNQQPSLSLILIGHSDLTGERSYNLNLSQRRAESVATLLVEDFSIAPERIKATGLGMQDPVTAQTGRTANAKNRRVEILFQPGDSNDSDHQNRDSGNARG